MEYNHEAEILNLIEEEKERAWDQWLDEAQEASSMFEEAGGECYINIQSPHSLSSELSSIASNCNT